MAGARREFARGACRARNTQETSSREGLRRACCFVHHRPMHDVASNNFFFIQSPIRSNYSVQSVYETPVQGCIQPFG